jgi:hypothetical protein
MKQVLQLIRPFREMRNIVALFLAFFLCAGSLWAQTQSTYTKVTSAPSDWSGEYLLVYEDATTAYVWTGEDVANCYASTTLDGTITIPSNAVSLTIAPMTDGYSIMVNGGTNDGKYISGTSGSNKINFGTTATANTISIESSCAHIVSNTSVMRFNSATNNMRFRYFKETSYTNQQPVQLYKLDEVSDNPSITASNLNIAYDATSGQIEYTINNPTNDGVLTASTDAEWISNVTATAAAIVTFTTTANTDAAQRTGTVTLTYTYGSNQTVTKNVTVTQAGNPNVPGSQNNPYTVAQARAAIDGAGSTQGVYATGIVSAIPYAYTSNNGITFNMVDNNGDAEFLQAYKCKGTEAPNVTVGDVVVVYGNLTKYNSTYEFGQNCQVVSLTHPSGYVAAPTFSPAAGTYTEPQTVTLSCETSGASIYYTLDGSEPDNESTLYTAAINVTTTTTINAIAYVGGNASDVATATYAIASLANISDIDLTEGGNAYEIQGTVVATNSRGFVMGDGTGYVYYYKNGTVTQSVGDMVTISGTTGTYGHIIQFTNTATVAEATSSNYDYTPAATLITEVPDYTQGYHLSTYLEFEGELTKNGNSYFIAVGGDTIQISYPTSAQGTTLTASNGMTVHVKGYFAGINSNGKFTTMLESVEEVASTDTTISVATLPFAFNGGKNDIDTIDGLTQDGLGSYNNSAANATTPLKFDNTGDWLLLHFNEQPGILTFDITGNGFSGGTFTVQASVDGVTYSDLASYTELGTTTTKEINNIGEDVRYIKWIYTNKASGNVGLGSITLDEPSTAPTILLDEEEIAVGYEGGEGNITVTYMNMGDAPIASVEFYEEDGEATAEYDWITAEIDAENNIHYTVDANEGEARTAYMKVYGITTDFADEAFSHLITVAQAAAPQQYELTISEFENLEIFTFVDDLNELALEGAGTITVTEGAAVSLSVSAEEGYILSSLVVDGQSVLSLLDETGLYTFEMPDHNVIVTASAIENVPGDWVLTSIEDLTENDIFVIVGTVADGTTYALPNDVTNSAPAATPVFVVDGTLSGEPAVNLQWNLSGNATDGYTFYPNGDAENWLFCNTTAASSNNNNIRVGNDENTRNVFVFDEDGYLVTNDDYVTRYLSIYVNSGVAQDWRGYINTNSAVAISFYKKVTTTNTCNIALVQGTNWVSFNVDVTLDDLKAALVAALPDGNSTEITIQSQELNVKYKRGRWAGQLSALDMAQMYKITVSDACEVAFEGTPVDPSTLSISINANGSTWIAFPYNQSMTVTNMFSSFPENNDQVLSYTQSTKYNRGRWVGQLTTLEAGQGYIYKTLYESPRTFTFPTFSRAARR